MQNAEKKKENAISVSLNLFIVFKILSWFLLSHHSVLYFHSTWYLYKYTTEINLQLRSLRSVSPCSQEINV